VLKFWLDLDVNGFRVDSAPSSFIYEDPELLDESKSNVDSAMSREYLKYIYTMDLIDIINCLESGENSWIHIKT